MKLVMLRGRVPNDQPPKNIMYDSLAANTDLWENLACSLGDERAEIYYVGGKRNVRYSEKHGATWVQGTDSIVPDFAPDVLFARGGFKEWVPVCKKFPGAVKVYYGSGVRVVPEHGKWDYVICDTQAQYDKLNGKGFNPVLWCKPAAPFFKPVETPKEYDVCYVADGRFPFRAKIKRVGWTYRNLPQNMTMLHLGWSGPDKPTKNITVLRVPRSEMPLYYSKCRCLAVPYRDYDSAPRVIPEALACSIPVVALDSVNFNNSDESVVVTNKEHFWLRVRQAFGMRATNPVTFNEAVEYLRGALGKG